LKFYIRECKQLRKSDVHGFRLTITWFLWLRSYRRGEGRDIWHAWIVEIYRKLWSKTIEPRKRLGSLSLDRKVQENRPW